jgi:hypothetical protein
VYINYEQQQVDGTLPGHITRTCRQNFCVDKQRRGLGVRLLSDARIFPQATTNAAKTTNPIQQRPTRCETSRAEAPIIGQWKIT